MAPTSSADAWTDIETCKRLIREGSRSFYTASLLLPRVVREQACALYAFCRLSDDAVDGPEARSDAVARLLDRLDAIYAGAPRDIAADRALARVVSDTGLPQALPAALLEGLAWDAAGRRFASLEDLHAYAARVASAVGAMMTVMMGVRDPDTLARACDLGAAMQLTNIARDVGEDARNGRIYLPLDWCREEGLVVDEFLAAPRFDHRVARVVERLLCEADRLYDRALDGIAGLPGTCRPAIHAARLIYREIGRVIRSQGCDSVSSRAVVPDREKMALVVRALGLAAVTPRGPAAPVLPPMRFLVEAVPAAIPRRLRADEKVVWVAELFSKLEERERDSVSRASR